MEARAELKRDQDHRAIPHGCISGWVYVGHLVVDEDGEEVEVIEQVRCHRCAISEHHARY